MRVARAHAFVTPGFLNKPGMSYILLKGLFGINFACDRQDRRFNPVTVQPLIPFHRNGYLQGIINISLFSRGQRHISRSPSAFLPPPPPTSPNPEISHASLLCAILPLFSFFSLIFYTRPKFLFPKDSFLNRLQFGRTNNSCQTGSSPPVNR